jgi:ubiquinol-cytochrome c reductase iron-sulfur subunit
MIGPEKPMGGTLKNLPNLLAGSPVGVDVSKLAPGEVLTVEWPGKPVWVVHPTPEMIGSLKKNKAMLFDPKSTTKRQPGYATNQPSSIRPEIFVAVGFCTHLGCSPSKELEVGAAAGLGPEWPGGFSVPAIVPSSTSSAAPSKACLHPSTSKSRPRPILPVHGS